MDQSESLQGQDEVWIAKLALLGCTVDKFERYFFVYYRGKIRVCGPSLPGIAKEVIDNIQEGLYT